TGPTGASSPCRCASPRWAASRRPHASRTPTMPLQAEARPLLARVAAWLDTASPWRVLAVLALVRGVTVGVWTTPNVHQWLLFASDPFGRPPIDPAASFITGSPTGPLVANLVGADTELTFALVHLVAL